MKNENNINKILFLLLIPIVVILYFFNLSKKKATEFKYEEVTEDQSENLDPTPVFASNGLNDRQMKVLNYISTNGVGKVSDMVSIFSQTDRTLRRDLNKLEAMGFVSRSGSTKSVTYTIKK